MKPLLISLILLGLGPAWLAAEELQSIRLPTPQTAGGKPLMQALLNRRTAREFKPEKLSSQATADLLWAAFGINRPQTGQRTAPSAMNSQEIQVYVALPEGLFLYEPKSNRLVPVLAGDIRSKAGGQESFRVAPLTLIYVAMLPRLAKATAETRQFYATFDAGCICQNVYLYCASEGLATVVHDLDRPALAGAMRLNSDQQIIFAQAVGWPGKSD